MNRNDDLLRRRVLVLPGVRIKGHRPWPPGSFTERLTSPPPGALGAIDHVTYLGDAPYIAFGVRLDDWTYLVNAELGRDFTIVARCRALADLAAMAATAATMCELSAPMIAAVRACWRPDMSTVWRCPPLQAPARTADALIARGLAGRWRTGPSDPGIVRLTGSGTALAAALHAAPLRIGATTHAGGGPR